MDDAFVSNTILNQYSPTFVQPQNQSIYRCSINQSDPSTQMLIVSTDGFKPFRILEELQVPLTHFSCRCIGIPIGLLPEHWTRSEAL